MTVHAHPDDESSKGPATIHRYAAEGVRTVLVCCTGGEAGDILNPEADTEEARADIGAVRRRELEEAVDIIGYHRLAWLGYRDSGMAGSETNGHPAWSA
jgi:LmbE family N-acetylglucosaminyl deacetylase